MDVSTGAPLYYFVSDTHLGLDYKDNKDREKLFVSFLQSLPQNTKALYLLGDIFDFWVEYKDVVPRGFVRVLGELAVLCDRGVEVYFFKGNHDYWTTDYLETEIGLKVVQEPYFITDIEGKRFCLGHGDGLGSHDLGYKLTSMLFRSKVCIFLLKMLHPRCVFNFARGWSLSRRKRYEGKYYFRGKEDNLYKFANEFGKGKEIDFFIFGHLHSPAEIDIPSGGKMYILGGWIKGGYYLYFSGIGVAGGIFPKIER
ncbi:MAG: UDP-2,3-diacylglucosamine diphosphatase [Bacteroidales bacterium]|nr:UDP-2,3-diacylglucosamine diphosphatase [Bacteroidales bacterium]